MLQFFPIIIFLIFLFLLIGYFFYQEEEDFDDPKRMSLGDRMKMYEKSCRSYIPQNSYVVIRLDGKNFSKFTKQFKKPFDDDFTEMMDNTAIELCKLIQGAKFAYVQSDEISILIEDVHSENVDLWFGGQIQKITSVSAAIASAEFNRNLLIKRLEKKLNSDNEYDDIANIISDSKLAAFDSRVFMLPDKWEVYNAFLWRQRDFKRNSISMAAHTHLGKSLHKKSTKDLLNMLDKKGIVWEEYPQKYKAGRIVTKQYIKQISKYGESIRSKWVAKPAFWFDKERQRLLELIPEDFFDSFE